MPNVWISLLKLFCTCGNDGSPHGFCTRRIHYEDWCGREKRVFLGGLGVSIIITVVTCVLYANVKLASTVDMPMLAIAEQIHPIFSLIYAFVIYGLIFNTAFSLFYALAKRFSSDNPKRFYPILIGTVVIGYALSLWALKN